MIKKLDLGCGKNKKENYIGIDISPDADADIIHDLNLFPYPFKNDEFDYINIDNVIEHLDNVVKVLEELHRISKNGANIRIVAPFFRSYYSYIDPTHKHFFSYRSFDYFDPKKDFHKKYKYSKCLFNVKKVVFDETITHGLPGKMLVWFANKYPILYETRISRIFILSTLNYYLETIKD
jgi:SAM-dependent methyltransferase